MSKNNNKDIIIEDKHAGAAMGRMRKRANSQASHINLDKYRDSLQ